MTLAAHLKNLRRQHGNLTQAQLAKKCGVSWSHIALLETRPRRDVSLKMLMDVLNHLAADEDAEKTAIELWLKARTGRAYRLVRRPTVKKPIQTATKTATKNCKN